MKRAVRLILDNKAEVLESDPKQIVRSAAIDMPRPLVIRLKRFIKVPEKFRRMVTNTFLFARDDYTCQFCGRKEHQLKKNEVLNRDHVFPQSRGGQNTWTNCVTACSTCNTKKADRTPQEANMKLLRAPKEPDMVHLRWQVRMLTPMQKKYITMFYGEDVFKKDVS